MYATMAFFELCSVIVLFISLYNFIYVIRNGGEYDIYANQFSTCVLVLHAILSLVTAGTFASTTFLLWYDTESSGYFAILMLN